MAGIKNLYKQTPAHMRYHSRDVEINLGAKNGN
jgi:hypothetical protein